jgi:hypothetical protein
MWLVLAWAAVALAAVPSSTTTFAIDRTLEGASRLEVVAGPFRVPRGAEVWLSLTAPVPLMHIVLMNEDQMRQVRRPRGKSFCSELFSRGRPGTGGLLRCCVGKWNRSEGGQTRGRTTWQRWMSERSQRRRVLGWLAAQCLWFQAE